MLPQELLENLHADTQGDLAVHVHFIYENFPNLYGDIVSFYKQRRYSDLLAATRSLGNLYKLKPYCTN